MPTSSTIFPIQAGSATTAADAVTFLGIGSAGDPTACRRLIHPTTLLAPILYAINGACHNPDRTTNLDNDILSHPIATSTLTLGSRGVVRSETDLSDQIVTETWAGSSSRASMTTTMWRQFYEYIVNPPATGAFITWEPRDRNAHVYNVEFIALTVGGGSAQARFDVSDIRALSQDTNIDTGMEQLNATNDAGLIDRTVRLTFRIVSKVS